MCPEPEQDNGDAFPEVARFACPFSHISLYEQSHLVVVVFDVFQKMGL